MAIPEPKCVQWKRDWQRAAREKTAGMTNEEKAAYRNKAHQELVRDHAEFKRQLEENRNANAGGATVER